MTERQTKALAATLGALLLLDLLVLTVGSSRFDQLLQKANGETIISSGLVSVLVSATVSLLSVWISRFWARRTIAESIARDLLAQALAIQALPEAWLLEMPPATPEERAGALSTMKGLGESRRSGQPWLRLVEVRAVLDEAEWNCDGNQLYGFIGPRRAWIIRDKILRDHPLAYQGAITSGHKPALMSSRGIEELCGWLARVASASRGGMLTPETRDRY